MVVGLVLAACGGDTTTTSGGPTTTAAPGGDTTTTAGGEKVTVKIGAAGPFTGGLAQIGNDALQAVTMAVEDYNASGKGRQHHLRHRSGRRRSRPGEGLHRRRRSTCPMTPWSGSSVR